MREESVKEENRLFGLNSWKDGINCHWRYESLRQERIQQATSCPSSNPEKLWKGNGEMRQNRGGRVFVLSKIELRVQVLPGSYWGQGKLCISMLSHPNWWSAFRVSWGCCQGRGGGWAGFPGSLREEPQAKNYSGPHVWSLADCARVTASNTSTTTAVARAKGLGKIFHSNAVTRHSTRPLTLKYRHFHWGFWDSGRVTELMN